MKNKIIIFTISLLVGLFIYFLLLNTDNNDKLVAYEKIIIEVGEEVPTIDSFFSSGNTEDELSLIKYRNIDESLKEKDLITDTIYYNLNNEEVTSKEALDLNGKLNQGYKSKNIIIKSGTYDVEIIKGKKKYISKLVIRDSMAPKLVLKNIQIEEGRNVLASDFVDYCTDNSREVCKYEFVKKNGTEYEIIDKIDLSVGERDVCISASDNSFNQIVECAKITVNKKR